MAAHSPRPKHSGNLPPNPPTPEQIRRTEEARLKSKALRAQHDATHASGQVAGQKRPHSQVSGGTARDGAASGGFTRPAGDDVIRPAKNFDKFIEYDLSKMTDSKGGFLSLADDPNNRALHNGAPDPLADKPANMTLEEWERHVILQKLRTQRAGPFEPGISVLEDGDRRKSCRECGALEIDWRWLDVFDAEVCNACKERLPDRYSLLTKTEAREDYLLTNPELQDEELLPHLKKPNPHKSTWNDMQLYLRFQVEEYAFSERKWGSAEALDAEFARRETDKRSKKEKKFKAKLADLKKRTRTEAYRRNKHAGDEDAHFGVRIAGDRHVHEWGRPVMDQETGFEVKRCTECGMECEELDLG